MAYVSYKDKNKSGHYDWNILIALVLFLVAIIAFVLYKVFVLAEPATPVATPVVQAPVTKPNTNTAAKPEKAVEPKVAAKDESVSTHPAAKTEAVVSHVTPSSGKTKDEVMVAQPIENETKPVDKASLKCSAEDQKAGLCN